MHSSRWRRLAQPAGSGPAIGEAIQQAAPSFHTAGYFGTPHLRKPAQLAPDFIGTQLVTGRVQFTGADHLQARQGAFAAVLWPWMALV